MVLISKTHVFRMTPGPPPPPPHDPIGKPMAPLIRGALERSTVEAPVEKFPIGRPMAAASSPLMKQLMAPKAAIEIPKVVPKPVSTIRPPAPAPKPVSNPSALPVVVTVIKKAEPAPPPSVSAPKPRPKKVVKEKVSLAEAIKKILNRS